MSRCTGECCRCFTLPISPAGVIEAFERALAQDFEHGFGSAKHDGDRAVKFVQFEDIVVIAPMLIHLRTLKPGDIGPTGVPAEAPYLHLYTCKHLDRETGDCTIYERRPSMCREYPYSMPFCGYAGCTMAVDLRSLAQKIDGWLRCPGGRWLLWVKQKAEEVPCG